jgi:hypothetical protein
MATWPSKRSADGELEIDALDDEDSMDFIPSKKEKLPR